MTLNVDALIFLPDNAREEIKRLQAVEAAAKALAFGLAKQFPEARAIVEGKEVPESEAMAVVRELAEWGRETDVTDLRALAAIRDKAVAIAEREE